MKARPENRPVEFVLPPRGALERTGPEDPLHYYYLPVTGPLYRARIRTSLSLLSPPYKTVLEIGYGSGLLLPTLAGLAGEVHAVDRDSDPVEVGNRLKKIGVEAELKRGDAAKSAYPDGKFSLVVAISVLEHVRDIDRLLDEVGRILEAGGEFLVGMPRVDPVMAALFRLIGWNQARNAHVTTHEKVLEAAAGRFALRRRLDLPRFLPERTALYHCLLLVKT